MFLDVLVSLLDILSLVFLLLIIRFYIEPGNGGLSFLPLWLADKDSVLFIFLFFLLFSLKNLAAYCITKSQFGLSGKIAVRLTTNNMVRFQRSDFTQFVNVDSSAQIRNIAFQPIEFCQYQLSGIQQMLTQAILISLTVIAILLFNAKLFLLLFLILLPPVVLVFYLIRKRMAKSRGEMRSGNERSLQYLLDALKGYVEANVYNRNQFFLNRYINYRKRFTHQLFDFFSIQNLPPRTIEVFAVLGLFMLIAIAKWSGQNDGAAMVTIGAFMAAAYKIIPGMVKMINISGQIKAYEFSVGDLSPGNEQDRPNNSTRLPAIDSIRFENVNFQFNGFPVLTDLNFDINKGDFVCIRGRSGRGKTTIFNLLLGFLRPGSGYILIDEKPVDHIQLKQFWPAISYVRQDAFFIYDTVLRNITLDEEQPDENKFQTILEVSGLNQLASCSQEILQKMITENGKNLSGGQKQRVLIARALYKDADLILLDEPFNELDTASEKKLLDHFRKMANAGKTVLLITHGDECLSYCNKIISLD